MNRRQWLIDIRNQMGLTQEQMAEIAGIERSTYTKAENGNSIRIDTAKKIASAANCHWTLFFDNDCDEKEQSASSA